MLLVDLLAPNQCPPELRLVEILGLSADSRTVSEGFAFFAVPGHAGDGINYVEEAKRRGACVIVAQRAVACDLPIIIVDDVRAALAKAASRFYGHQPHTIVAVTGTSGKTSVVSFLQQIWRILGINAASLGTVGVIDNSGAHYGSLTTPGPVELHDTLNSLSMRGVTHLAMEASSLGIEQCRLDGVSLTAAAFTNFSRDHLDHHKDMAEYFAAKMRLFNTLMSPGQYVVIDSDSDVAQRVMTICRDRGLKIFSVGINGQSIKIQETRTGSLSTQLRLTYGDQDYAIELPLTGAFQVSNALVAAGLAIVCGASADQVFGALTKLQGAPGRLERIGVFNGAPIFVDYAHKPDALEKVLGALRPLTRKRLILVFGCGGDRDRGKRPLMGEIAAREADVIIVTDDNPRNENPTDIRSEIIRGAHDSDAMKILEVADRREAIRIGMQQLSEGDTLVVAGKGHETGQIIGDRTLPFSDHETIKQLLREETAVQREPLWSGLALISGLNARASGGLAREVLAFP